MKFRNLSWWAFALSLTIFQAGTALAIPCTDCDRFKSMLPAASLASDVSAIGATALHSEGKEFQQEQDIAAAWRVRIDSDKMIPGSCKSYLKSQLKMPHFQVVLSGMLGGNQDPSQFGYQATQANMLVNAFQGYYQSQYPVTCSSGSSTTNCYDASGAAKFAQYTKWLQSSSDATVLAAMSPYGITKSDVQTLRAYNLILNAPTEAAAIALIKQGKDGLSTDQFLTLVQMYGRRMSDNYDFNRIKPGDPASKGSVDGTALNQAALISTETQGMDQRYAGVCRDIASFQGKMLEAKGFKNTYVVAYAVNDGYHATVITQDPTKARQLYAFDYDSRSDRKDVDGAEALHQSYPWAGLNDFTMNYRIYKPGGRLVADVPSEMGKFLSEASGFDIKRLDGLARPSRDLLAANVGIGSKDQLQLRLYTGTDATTSRYVGFGADYSWGNGTLFPGKVGLTVGDIHRPGSVFNYPKDGDMLYAYAQVEQHAMTPKIQLTPNAKLQLDAAVVAGGMVQMNVAGEGSNIETGQPNTTNFGGFNRVITEARVEQKALGGKLQAEYKVGAVGVVDTTDVRSGDANKVMLLPTQVYAGAEATLDVKNLKLFGDALVIADALGARGKLEAGVASRDVAASAYVSGRLTNDTALLEDGSIRRVGISVTAKPTKWLRLGVTGEIPVEGDDPVGKARLFGTGALVF